jgi:hydroxymethylpyrimidine pyrophosphatase-like HAD family hydrolase
MNQIAEDHIHRDPLFLGTTGDQFMDGGGMSRRVVGRSLESAASLLVRARIRRGSAPVALGWQRQAARLTTELARAVMEVTPMPDYDSLLAQAEALQPLPPSLRDEIARLPSCFQAFDLRPTDVRELIARFSAKWPSRTRPLLVAGVRTSGSYLGPLCAASLESCGYERIELLTSRPDHQLFEHERTLAHKIADSGGLCLVVDDPPGSGRSVSHVTAKLRREGFDEHSLVLLLPLFGSAETLPPTLHEYPSIVLPNADWSIRQALTPTRVRAALGRLVGPDTVVTGVRPLPSRRGHVQRRHERAVLEVEFGDGKTTAVLAQGVGLGYYGAHAEAVSRALKEHLPRVYGVDDGCLLREWLPDEQRAGPDERGLLDAVARYVVDRQRALPAVRDATTSLVGQRPVWEAAAAVLARVFGRGATAARLLFVGSVTRRALRVRRPSVVDGSASMSNWFSEPGTPRRFVKVEFFERAFWNLGLTCYDAAFDIVGAAVSAPNRATADELRVRYERRAGARVDDERWLLYELAHLWSREREHADRTGDIERRYARAFQSYFARRFLADLGPPQAGGPLCAVDLDGVLETQALGFPAASAAGLTALRALIAHGFRPILVTGRSAGEAIERCAAYSCDGAVAEYGSIVHSRGATVSLLSVLDRGRLEQVREILATTDGVLIDPAYLHTVRAFRLGRDERRRGLDARTVARTFERMDDPDRIRAVTGAAQTDFVAADVDKGSGVRALHERLGSAADRLPLAFAVGDTAADLPMLRLAERAFAPSNADDAVRSDPHVHVLGAPYQTGLALAVGQLIGHRPGSCPRCRTPPLTKDARAILAIVSARERDSMTLARRFVWLGLSARR